LKYSKIAPKRVKMLIYQSHDGYCYNSDSIFLAHFISSFEPKGNLLDVGCGVGVLSIILSRTVDTVISAIDTQEKMCKYAKHNYANNNITATLYNEDFTTFKTDIKFDVIISNPPFYAPSVYKSDNECLSIARYASSLPMDIFFEKVHKLLTNQGRFYFCYDAKQIVDILVKLKKHRLTPEVIRFVHSKINKDSKLVMIACRHNSKAVSRIMAPMIVFDENNEYTADAKEAFLHASLHSIKGEMSDI
jgi:tRNA1(Val) A37 N6-methylase TrmN6